MAEGWRLDERTVGLLESAVAQGDAAVIELVQRAAARASVLMGGDRVELKSPCSS